MESRRLTRRRNPTIWHRRLQHRLWPRRTISIQLFDLLGKVIKTEQRTFATGDQQLAIETNPNLAAGVYYLRVQTEGQQHQTFKIMHLGSK